MTFKVGQKVRWSSSSAGSTTEKVGEVVVLVKARTYPNVSVACQVHNAHSQFGYGMRRNHDSYLVLVRPASGKGKPSIYWPRVSALQPA
jgi:hypothetical protein